MKDGTLKIPTKEEDDRHRRSRNSNYKAQQRLIPQPIHGAAPAPATNRVA
jgi:hypothetical protein